MTCYLNDCRMLSVKEHIIDAVPVSMVKALSSCSAESWGSIQTFQHVDDKHH